RVAWRLLAPGRRVRNALETRNRAATPPTTSAAVAARDSARPAGRSPAARDTAVGILGPRPRRAPPARPRTSGAGPHGEAPPTRRRHGSRTARRASCKLHP